MTDPAESKMAAWVRGVGLHLGLIAVSLLLSLMIAPATISFDPEGSGVFTTIIAIIFGHALAAVVGLCFPKPTKVSCTIVFSIAFFFSSCFAVEAIVKSVQQANYMRYQAPYDRFRDWIISPIPNSVTNIRFLTFKESITSNANLEFDIDPKDMDLILEKLNLVKKDPDKLLNPKDYFQVEYYMPIDGDYHLYQQSNYSPDDYTVTMKLSAKHDHAIFRSEIFWFYRDRSWEKTDGIQVKMDLQALEKLKQEFEKSHSKSRN